MTMYTGQCHCGRVKFEADFELKRTYQCNCSYCRRRNAVMHRVATVSFRVTQGKDAITLYQFHTRVAKHYFCEHCGIFVYSRLRTSATEYAINLHAIEVDYSKFPIQQLDGKSFD